jgi:hypothetical protein
MKKSVQWTALRVSKLIKNEYPILMLNLSDNNLEQAQFNTIFYQIDKRSGRGGRI